MTSDIELGYVAAPMAFSFDTEEVVLTVNGIRKVSMQQSAEEVCFGADADTYVVWRFF
jgi:hypothetical protein